MRFHGPSRGVWPVSPGGPDDSILIDETGLAFDNCGLANPFTCKRHLPRPPRSESRAPRLARIWGLDQIQGRSRTFFRIGIDRDLPLQTKRYDGFRLIPQLAPAMSTFR